MTTEIKQAPPTTPVPKVKSGHSEFTSPDGKVLRYLTVEEWKAAARLEVSDKIWKRKGTKKERHRVVSVRPQFTGSSGTDIQTITIDGEDKDVVFCIPRALVEKFRIEERKVGDKNEKFNVPLSSWTIDCLDFMEEFERFPDDD